MSELTIYQSLRNGGLSAAGACAMLGNWDAESCLIPSNVEDRCTLGDFDYTYAVDVGTISRYQFKVDAYGYGLAQWTYPTRKEGLYDLAKSKNVSISDEAMQLEFCLMELHTDEFINLYKYLCTTDDLPEATKRICAEYERPAVNNFAVRINAAQKFFNEFALNDNGEYSDPDDEPPQFDIIHSEYPRTFLHLEYGDGCKARGYKPDPAIKAWQNLLLCWGFDVGSYGADGEFGNDTLKATKEWQAYAQKVGADVEVNGVVDEDDWLAIVEVEA